MASTRTRPGWPVGPAETAPARGGFGGVGVAYGAGAGAFRALVRTGGTGPARLTAAARLGDTLDRGLADWKLWVGGAADRCDLPSNFGNPPPRGGSVPL